MTDVTGDRACPSGRVLCELFTKFESLWYVDSFYTFSMFSGINEFNKLITFEVQFSCVNCLLSR